MVERNFKFAKLIGYEGLTLFEQLACASHLLAGTKLRLVHWKLFKNVLLVILVFRNNLSLLMLWNSGSSAGLLNLNGKVQLSFFKLGGWF